MAALSGFLDLFRLADHPGDVPSYRHFSRTPLAAAKYPGGVPPAGEVSRDMALSLAGRGVAGTLRGLRALLPADPDAAWNRFTERMFADMLLAAEEFERSWTPETRMSDFPAFFAGRQKAG